MNIIHPITPAERAQSESAMRDALLIALSDSCPPDYYDDAPERPSDGYDPRAPFPHASDPHWSSPEADFARW